MPWTAGDADRHIKGLTSAQKRVWARVANRALSACLSDGGTQADCEGRAIRQANSVAKSASESADWLADILEEFEEARSFEKTADMVRSALRTKINPSPGDNGPFGPWVIQTFADNVVYEWQGKTWQADYSIDTEDGESRVTIGDPVEVEVTYQPVSESESDATLEESFVALSERAVRGDGTAQVKIIEPGWGSSGYYSEGMLKRDGPKVFSKGLKMFWDHPTPEEEAGRPERSLRDLAGELVTDARFLENGPDGKGLYADAKIFDTFAPAVEELAPHIGVSIRAAGTGKQGTAEGRKGTMIDKLIAAQSVDFVTEPGAGGQIVEIFESARRRSKESHPEDDMDENQVRQMIEAQTKPLTDQVNALQESLNQSNTQLEEAKTENARLREGLVLREARDFVAETLNGHRLPDVTRTRLLESLSANPPLKEGALDKDAYKTAIDEAVKKEVEYLESIAGPAIKGMNSGEPGEVNLEETQKKLESTFAGFGLSEGAAKAAAAGR